jgi:hypothetical protein
MSNGKATLGISAHRASCPLGRLLDYASESLVPDTSASRAKSLPHDLIRSSRRATCPRSSSTFTAYIVGYVSPRTNGQVGGRFLIAGLSWAAD